MDEELAAKLVGLEDGATSSGDLITIVIAREAELDQRRAAVGRDTVVNVGLDRDQPKAARLVRFESKTRRLNQVEIVLRPHLGVDDSPSSENIRHAGHSATSLLMTCLTNARAQRRANL